jgi:hypothetical protein
VLVTRVGAFLEPLRLGFVAVGGLVADLWPIIVLAFTQTIDVVTGLLSGPNSVPAILHWVMAAFAGALRRIGLGLGATFAVIRGELSSLTSRGGMLAEAWWADMQPLVRAETVDHPTVRYLRSFIGSLGVFSSWRDRGAAPPGPPSPPGTLGKLVGWALRKTGMPTTVPSLPRLPVLPPLLPLGSIPAIVDALDLMRSLGFGFGPANPIALPTEQLQVLARAERPPSVFGAEWAALEAETRRPEPLARTLEVATYLSLARRVVGPAAAAAVRSLEDVLSRIDAVVRTERQRLPVRDVPEPTQLTPVIQRLRVRSRGRASEALDAWVADLRIELNALEYPVPVGG